MAEAEFNFLYPLFNAGSHILPVRLLLNQSSEIRDGLKKKTFLSKVDKALRLHVYATYAKTKCGSLSVLEKSL